MEGSDRASALVGAHVRADGDNRWAHEQHLFGHRASWTSATMSDDEAMSVIKVEADNNDGEYHPRGSPIPPVEPSPSGSGKQLRKRGRKPNLNQSIRSAREAARKANHSVIEYVVPFCHFLAFPLTV